VPRLRGEPLLARPPKYVCLLELIVQNVSTDFSMPPGALEEAEIMKNYQLGYY